MSLPPTDSTHGDKVFSFSFRKHKVIKKSLILSLALISSLANARRSIDSSTVGMDIKFLTSQLSTTVFFGWRYMHHPSREFSLGGAGYLGQSTGTNSGSLAYGGLFASWNAAVTAKSAIELGLLAGGAGGVVNTTTTYGGVCLEPSLAFSFALGPSVGAALNFGYLYIPTSTQGSGINGGLRFEFNFERPEAAPRLPPAIPPVASSATPSSAKQ